MLRTVFAMSVAGLLFAALPGNAQAAPMARLPAGLRQTPKLNFEVS
jgi:hypothetical protein